MKLKNAETFGWLYESSVESPLASDFRVGKGDGDISFDNLNYERVLRNGERPRIGRGRLLIKPGEVCSRIMDKIV